MEDRCAWGGLKRMRMPVHPRRAKIKNERGVTFEENMFAEEAAEYFSGKQWEQLEAPQEHRETTARYEHPPIEHGGQIRRDSQTDG
jgi:hypothetical protein